MYTTSHFGIVKPARANLERFGGSMDKQIIGYVVLDELGDFLGYPSKIFGTVASAEAYVESFVPDSDEHPGMTEILGLVELWGEQ